jgi:hypothetical protein
LGISEIREIIAKSVKLYPLSKYMRRLFSEGSTFLYSKNRRFFEYKKVISFKNDKQRVDESSPIVIYLLPLCRWRSLNHTRFLTGPACRPMAVGFRDEGGGG